MHYNHGVGAVAQLGERSVRNAEVEGSIPFRSISRHALASDRLLFEVDLNLNYDFLKGERTIRHE